MPYTRTIYKGLPIITPNPAGTGADVVQDAVKLIADNLETLNAVGVSGYSGYSGRSGYSGFSGYSGYSGFSGANGADASPANYYVNYTQQGAGCSNGGSTYTNQTVTLSKAGTLIWTNADQTITLNASTGSWYLTVSDPIGCSGGGDTIIWVNSVPNDIPPTGASNWTVYTDSWVSLGANPSVLNSITSDYTGQSGYSGFSGKSGYSGYSGRSGYSGFSGYSGSAGSAGTSGFSGFSGYSGRSGYSGYSGLTGSTGSSGFSGYSGSSTVTNSSGSATLASTYTLTTSLAATGVSVSLPAAGTYMIIANVRFGLNGNYGMAQFHDDTGSAYIGSKVLGHFDGTNTNLQTTVAFCQLATVTGASTVSLHAQVSAITGTNYIYSDSAGATTITWVRLS